jgi:hypothetical protein
MSATLDGVLWEYNLARVVILDVSDDYRLMRSPLPTDCYPVLAETWVPTVCLPSMLAAGLVDDYLYDWHQSPDYAQDPWYVGVVHRKTEPILS